MPVWILVVLLPLGEPYIFQGDVLGYFDDKRNCMIAMNREDKEYDLACIKIK